MKKLSLKLDDLAVDSFVTRPQADGARTVLGHEATADGCITDATGCGHDTCAALGCVGTFPDPQTTDCGGSGAPSCGATCGITGNWKCVDGCNTDW